ncbi:hypothetical protein SELMODRAFT_429952 [Selaginella moellendorffii]|uniref:Uncharacterized protein n=1 Tax=Selaginella moellendorffii TaxID=88036 RepID=D8T7V6_SELML|nr:hypothetical protein SELMODRAFT_429952 [Selaginella moellendorffii]
MAGQDGRSSCHIQYIADYFPFSEEQQFGEWSWVILVHMDQEIFEAMNGFLDKEQELLMDILLRMRVPRTASWHSLGGPDDSLPWRPIHSPLAPFLQPTTQAIIAASRPAWSSLQCLRAMSWQMGSFVARLLGGRRRKALTVSGCGQSAHKLLEGKVTDMGYKEALSMLEKDEELGKWLTLSHTLIWEILGGEWPLGEIDIHGEEWMAHLAAGFIKTWFWLGAMEMERLHKGPEEPIKCHGGWSKEEHMALIRKVQEHLQRPEDCLIKLYGRRLQRTSKIELAANAPVNGGFLF